MTFDHVPLEDASPRAFVQPRLGLIDRLIFLLVSFALASLSVVWPFFEHLATDRQSLNLYIGFAMSQGQPPYSDVVTTGGFLYHSLVALAYHVKALPALIVPYGLAFYLAAVYLYKLIAHLTQKEGLAWSFSLIFLGFNLVLGLGNLYPIQLAQGFVLMGLWQLLGVRDGRFKDEALIGYGVLAALSLLLEPRTLVFWLSSAVFLLLTQRRQRLGWRALYQHLAVLTGFLLVTYLVGYVILNTQILLPYLQQTVVTLLLPLIDGHSFNYWGLAAQLFALFGLGFVANMVNGWRRVNADRPLTAYLSMMMIWYGILALLSQGFGLYDLLHLVPFGLLLSAIRQARKLDQLGVADTDNHRLSRRHQHQASAVETYLKTNLFLPLLVLVLGIGFPIYHYSQNISHFQDRQLLADYLSKETSSSEAIYVWDWSAKIYLEAKRLSSSQFPIATVETSWAGHRQLLEDEWLQQGAIYVAVNKDLPLSQALQEELSEDYKPVQLEGLDRFELYRLD